MTELALYFAKSTGILLLFLGLYLLLLRKETFFNGNRFFLLVGMIVSLVLPFLVITKYVEVPALTNTLNGMFVNAETVYTQGTSLSLIDILLYAYIAGVLFFFCKFLIELASLCKLLWTSSVSRRDGQFIYIETTSTFSPFSFFNYIVYNPALYSESELTAILKHEQAHSRQLHSLDVFAAKLYCILLWFNPLAWLHRKFILQNLEFLADSSAIKQIPSKKEYQLTLLKVSGHTYCPALTNNFYNSLIKKRIVMLQKTQSKHLNRWKQVLILPMLIAFVFLFNTEVIAKEVSTLNPASEETSIHNEVVGDFVVIITKNTSIEELKAYKKLFSSQDIKFKYSAVDFNDKKEIIAIKLELKEGKNDGAVTFIESSEGKAIPNIKVGKMDGKLIISSANAKHKHDGTTYEFHSDEKHKGKHDGKNKKIVVTSTYTSGDHDSHNNVWISKDDVKTVDIKKVNGKEVIIVNEKKLSANDIIEEEIEVVKENGKNHFLIKNSSGKKDGDTEIEIIEEQDNKIVFRNSNTKKPLFIIDGKQVKQSKMDNLDANDIESVSVLKGESATKLYGDKGKDGVIIITTKK
jgi:bla regulator protein BlaR1